MKRRSGPRKTANLSDSIHHQLYMYALAASATGVSLLALAQPAQAKIVYTPADKWLPLNRTFYLDLNHDGVNDFRFRLDSANWSTRFSRGFVRSLGAEAAESSQSKNAFYYSVSQGHLCAPALRKGTRLGPTSPFTTEGPWMFLNSYQSGEHLSACEWSRVKNQAYLGLRFTIKGQVHYGWARFGYISVNHRPKAKLTGYAYETIPGKAIKAGQTKAVADDSTNEDFAPNASLTNPTPSTPQPVSLGMLSLGANGVPLWRRKELLVGTQ
jgi:hypothetical protein